MLKVKVMLAKKDQKLYDVLLLGMLFIISYLVPFAAYTFENEKYTLTGIEFIMGKTILGGTLIIPPNICLGIGVCLAVAIMAAALGFPKMKGHKGGVVICLLGTAEFIINILFAMQVNSVLNGAKKITIMYGSVILLVISAVIIARGLQILAKQKVVSALDFMLIPGLLYLLINNYLPMFGIFIAFKKVDYRVGIFKSSWVGAENFKYLFTTADAWIITRNTILYNAVFIILGSILGIMVGIFLSELINKKLQKFYQTAILLPQLISMIIVSYMVYAFLSNESGFINNTILGGNSINFYTNTKYWPFILTFVSMWKMLGYNSIIYLSSVVGIDRSLYEASYVDGAGRWKQIKHITLPLLKPTIITLVLLQVGRIFYSDFGLFYQVPMDSGSLYTVTNTIDTYVYRSLLKLNNISMASAASVYQSIVGFLLVLGVNAIVRKVDKENALF